MIKKSIPCVLVAMFMLSACGSTHQQPSNTKQEIIVDVSFPTPEEENYVWEEREYKPFPQYPTTASSLNYRLSEDGTFYIVSKPANVSQTTIVIPSTYQNLPVQEIETEGFAYLSNLQTIYIPSSIHKIGNGAFNGSGLKQVYYDATNVADFNAKNWVFYPSTNQSIDFYVGPHVSRIPARLFYPLTTNPSLVPHVNHIYFDPDCKLQEIGDYAFYKLNAIESISLPDTIERIGDYAFYESGLNDVILPKMCQTIGKNAFAYSALTHILFQENLQKIESYAFYGCASLAYLDLLITKVETISSYAFASCHQVSTLLLPYSLKEIAEGAFLENTSLKNVCIPDQVLAIGMAAFKDCSTLAVISLGRNLTTLGHQAFANCTNVKKLLLFSKKLQDVASENNIFANLGKARTDLVVILKDVEYVPTNLFYASCFEEEQPHIKQLILDKSIGEIGENAFFHVAIDEVDYLGTVAQWNQIVIHDYNTILNQVQFYEIIQITTD